MRDITLVTGATGFIGQYVVKQLLKEGELVRILCRRPEAIPPDVRQRIDIVKGDILDRHAMKRAMAGVGTVLHLAGCARAWSRNPREFWDVNVKGTELVLDFAERAGVDRVVHVSTVLTLPEFVRTWLLEQRRKPTEYEYTKLMAERHVLAYRARGGDAVVVHPTRVYGPGPLTDANGTAKMIALYLAGRFRLRVSDGDVLGNYAHVEDVACGMILAARRGQSGTHYVLGGENASIRQLFDLVAELTGVRRHMLAVRPAAAIGVGHLSEFWGRLGGQVLITADWVRVYLEDQGVDIAQTVRELGGGYRPRPLRVGIAQTLEWLGAVRENELAA
ncbi:MAG: NAD-dependent epimerase/dehydratase family protein [Gemmatimonadales bacterium]|nr:NAD-dependent epimerase/dehydratase family protein [Gemmatimonadales bacterium]